LWRKMDASVLCRYRPGSSGSATAAFAAIGLGVGRDVVSGVGSCAFAMATALPSELAERRSCIRRSIRVPHMPQNLKPGSLTNPQAHLVLAPDGFTLLSPWRRSNRTPHIPQNLYSARFSVPQKVHCIGC